MQEQRFWCGAAGAWVRVLAREQLFGRSTVKVLTEDDRVLTVGAESLTAERPTDAGEVAATAAGARLWHALGSDLLLAPLVSRVLPLPHQFRVLRRAMGAFPIRLLLADEVGLGKTIEAGLILKELKLRGLAERVLVLAPKSLLMQWVAEMDRHFDERFDLVEPGAWGVGATLRGENPWRRCGQVVTSFDAVKPRAAQRGWSDEQIERFNLGRFHDLVGAGWDLVIVDESHKVAGAGEEVARFELAAAVAAAAPHLLLLSATPHSGKSDAFRRLLSLLDPAAFPPGGGVSRAEAAPWVIRTEKRTAADAEGRPLFAPRVTRLLKVPFEEKHAAQRRLYEEITAYVVEGYNRAAGRRDQASRLLLILIQRLVSSSTRAVRRFLEAREQVLTAEGTGAPALPGLFDGDEADGEDAGGEALAAVLVRQAPRTRREAEEVRALLDLAVQVEAAGADARAEALYGQMVELARRDGEPGKKFLVFTEFTATQAMLAEYLAERGYVVATLNGSMGLEERRGAEVRFRGEAQVLISTDAGGEGLNLQFAHVVFNYDLPWNPMRLEQRIGRVDRIGQKREVLAINLALENSVEARVYDVLLTKLEVILQEFGVDKAGDVLDSREAGNQFEELARTALLRPEALEGAVEKVLREVRRAAEGSRDVRELAEPVGGERAPELPLRAWVSTLLGQADGETAGADLGVAAIERIRELRGCFVPGRPAPVLALAGVGFELDAWFSVWRVGIAQGGWRRQHTFAVCVTEAGASYGRSAERIWEALAAGAGVALVGETEEYDEQALRGRAEAEAAALFEGVVRETRERATRRRRALDMSYLARKAALGRIGLPAVQEARRAELDAEYRAHQRALTEAAEAVPDLRCLLLARVRTQ